MAVEARHLPLFPPQILPNRETVNNHMYGGGAIMGYGLISGTTTSPVATPADTLIPHPMYGTTMASDSVMIMKKSDSGLTCSVPPVIVSRKRPRDCSTAGAGITTFPANNNSTNSCGSLTFLGEDISHQIHHQQSELDLLITQHVAKVKRVIEEQRKSYLRRIIKAMEENITKKLKAKDEEIENIGKLNWALEEKLKSLYVENQLWRELAENNEATANALRSNLEQVLAQSQAQAQHQNGPLPPEGLVVLDDDDDDVQSCCGSNLVIEEGVEQNNAVSSSSTSSRLCRNCGKEEASVLLLPCRHLCLCYTCGPALHSCPICLTTKNATLHINMSSS